MKQFLKNFKYPLSISLSLIAIFFIFQNGTCSQSSMSGDTSSASTGSNNSSSSNNTLSITVSASTVAAGGTVTFTASGGTAPYYYSAVSGGGSFASATSGVFIAPSYASTCVVRVTDSTGSNYQTSSVTVGTSASGVYLTPATATVQTNGTVQFSAGGGTAPYTYLALGSLGSFRSSSSGVFTAGSVTGTMQIQAVDALSRSSPIGTVTVTGTTTSASYRFISATALNTASASGDPWNVNHLIDQNTGTCYSSTMYGSANAGTPYVTLTLGDSVTGAAGATYSVDHLYLNARGGGSPVGFPQAYSLSYLDSNGAWQLFLTAQTQPDSNGLVTLNFTPVTTSAIRITATYMHDDGNAGHYYFQMCEVSH